jgi:pyrroline-5-carboxylate reductase
MRLGLIGGGYMGEAIVSAVLKQGLAKPGDITVSDVADARRTYLSAEYGIATTVDNATAASAAELLVLAVKPQEFSNVAAGLRGKLSAKQTIVSIMAGVPIRRIDEALGHDAVARAMPNTAAFVGQAMSVWIAAPGVAESARAAIASVLQAMGREFRVDDEQYLDMATAVNGSGPGFVFLFLEALIDAAVHLGIPRKMAEELSVQTLLGSAVLARETGKPAAELRAMVTSKGGTTAAGLQVLEDAGIRATISEAIAAAHKRAQELSN